MRSAVLIPTCISLCLVLVSCLDTSNTDLKQYIEMQKKRPPPPIEEAPEIVMVEAFAYSAGEEGLRSPFDSLGEITNDVSGNSESGIMPDATRPKEQLESFSLETLRMVGGLSLDDNDFALILSPDNIVHRVTTGNYLGHNHGRIINIYPDRVELEEIVPDGFGGYKTRAGVIALKEN